MLFIVKFFPEIVIKGKQVRKQMTRRLRDNLLAQLHPICRQIRVLDEWDKLVINLPEEVQGESLAEVVSVLGRTSGVASFLEVEAASFESLEDICRIAGSDFAPSVSGKRFVVRCKRSGKHPFNSIDVERHVGGFLLQHSQGAVVDLHTPEVTVPLEIKGQTLYLVKRRREGLGGFPLGEVEPVLSLISGGFDSPVASFLSMRRGMPTHFCFFNLGGREHELGVKEVPYHLWQRYGAARRVKFISVPFEPVVAGILQSVESSQMGVILKRMMLRVASRLAERLEVQALVTGEAVAQVSSQTLTNLSVIDSVTPMLVLRPLIMTDKEEIIRIARKIGTAQFAENMPEYCGVISVKPTTRAREYRIEKEEARFDFGLIEEALAKAQILNIDEIANMQEAAVDVEVLEVPVPDAVIIDIRHPEEEERKPLQVGGQSIEKIPFYTLRSKMAQWPRERRYLLYCEKGVMSRLHAAHLVEEGYRVAVFRPPVAGIRSPSASQP